MPVAKFGIFTPHIPLLERSTDSVRVHFAAFRSQQAKGSVLALASLAVAATGFFLAIGKNNSKNLGTGLAIGGLALTFGSGIALRHAGNQLAQAVWWYNRPLRQP